MSAHGLDYVPRELIDRLNEQIRHILHVDGTDYEGATLAEAYETLLKAFFKDGSIADSEKRKWPIASGKVYLAQLMAHDLIQTVETGCEDVPYENLVRRPLMLETIYGRGPDVQPFLYQIRKGDDAEKNRPVFRPKFRLGVFASTVGNVKAGLDLPRALACLGSDGSGLQSSDPNFTLREAIIADRRNDSHTILAQITAVWMLFHNCVYDELIAQVEKPTTADMRASFASAKRIVTASWHAVIENDIYPIILKDGGAEAGDGSVAEAAPHNWMDPVTGLPSAEARIAFRCLHGLPRTHYDFSAATTKSLSEVLNVASERLVGAINTDWIVNWRSFFDFGKKADAKHRTRYVDGFAEGMTRGHDGAHLLRADLERALEILKSPDAEGRLAKFVSEDFIQTLAEVIARVNAGPDTVPMTKALSDSQQEQVIRFPPLLIYLMKEAADETKSDHLGPTGTKLLSPWLLGPWNRQSNVSA